MKFESKENIDLEYSLDGGQAFRWWNVDKGYRGVVGTHVYILENNNDFISINVLNKNDDFQKAISTIRNYLSLNNKIDDFVNLWIDDPCIGPSVRGYSGLRVLKQDPWECLFSFICSSTNNVSRIKLNVNDVSILLGEKIFDGKYDFSFPKPEQCIVAGENVFRKIGLGFRSKYVIDAARKILDGSIILNELKSIEYLEARDKLMTINGVGGKIADCVLAFSLDKKESFPVDRHILRALIKWYGLPKNIMPEQAAIWARKRFGRHSSLANQYIFHRERLSSRYHMWGGKHRDLIIDEDK